MLIKVIPGVKESGGGLTNAEAVNAVKAMEGLVPKLYQGGVVNLCEAPVFLTGVSEAGCPLT